MRELVLTSRFERAFRRVSAKNPALQRRIVFSKQKHPKTGAETLLLINIGTHEEVY